MQERVCIVLNERESHKAKAADSLAARLKDYNITSSRVAIDENIVKILTERKPKILVIDYLLGDYSTGLDVIAALNELQPDLRPRTFFLTDEPSVSVAVAALRLGALDYLEIENPQSINRLAREIHESLQQRQESKQRHVVVPPRLDDLVASSKASVELIKQARVIAAQNIPLLIVHGPAGSGRSTMANAVLSENCPVLARSELNLRFFTGSLDEVFNPLLRLAGESHHCLIVKNPEDDDGSFIEYILKIKKSLSNPAARCHVAVCVEDEALLKAWLSALDPVTLRIPELAKRADDIPFFIQRFLRLAQETSGLKVKPFSGEIVSWLSTLDWPGDLRQLLSIVVHAGIQSTFDDGDLKSIIEAQRALWLEEREAAALKSNLTPLTAAMALECSGGNFRSAAARLGCSIQQLRGALHHDLRE